MAGQYTNYYHRIGKGKSKRYQCVFESCGNHIVKKLSSIYSHVQRTHIYEIRKIEKEKQEEIECEKRTEELAEQELKWWEENKEKIKEQEKRDEEQRQKEEARMIEMWNRIQKEIENERIRKRIIGFWFLSKLVRSNKSWQEKSLLFIIANQIGII